MEVLSSTVCRSCRLRMLPSRAFGTTTRRQIVPPESPAFIDVPSTHQPDLYISPRQKGVLPVPRELFPRQRPDKPSPTYLDNVTANPLPHNVKDVESLTEAERYRLRSKEKRKSHLREGLTELHKRKQMTDAALSYRQRQKISESARLVSQAPRKDERLTSSTTTQAMASHSSKLSHSAQLAHAKEVYERKKANYEAHLATTHEKRMDALHTLYMNARNFITTQEQLEEVISREFDHPDFGNDISMDGQSMWSTGVPDTVKDMIAVTKPERLETRTAGLVTRVESPQRRAKFERDQRRFQKIAEKLSGGKI